jgi:hypothetical protein
MAVLTNFILILNSTWFGMDDLKNPFPYQFDKSHR